MSIRVPFSSRFTPMVSPDSFCDLQPVGLKDQDNLLINQNFDVTFLNPDATYQLTCPHPTLLAVYSGATLETEIKILNAGDLKSIAFSKNKRIEAFPNTAVSLTASANVFIKTF